MKYPALGVDEIRPHMKVHALIRLGKYRCHMKATTEDAVREEIAQIIEERGVRNVPHWELAS